MTKINVLVDPSSGEDYHRITSHNTFGWLFVLFVKTSKQVITKLARCYNFRWVLDNKSKLKTFDPTSVNLPEG